MAETFPGSGPAGIPQEAGTSAFEPGGRYNTPDEQEIIDAYVVEDDLPYADPGSTSSAEDRRSDPDAIDAVIVDEETGRRDDGQSSQGEQDAYGHPHNAGYNGPTADQYAEGVNHLGEQINTSVRSGFGTLGDRLDARTEAGFRGVADAVGTGFNQVSSTMDAGFNQVDATLAGGLGAVEGRLGNVEDHAKRGADATEDLRNKFDAETAAADQRARDAEAANAQRAIDQAARDQRVVDGQKALLKIHQDQQAAETLARQQRDAHIAALPIEQNPFGANGYMSIDQAAGNHASHLQTSANPATYPGGDTAPGVLPTPARTKFLGKLPRLLGFRNLTSGEPQLPHFFALRPNRKYTDEVDSSRKKSRYELIQQQREDRNRPV